MHVNRPRRGPMHLTSCRGGPSPRQSVPDAGYQSVFSPGFWFISLRNFQLR